MLYKVIRPFTTGNVKNLRGDILGPEIEKARKFRDLVNDHRRDPFIEPLGNDDEEFVDHCYIALRRIPASNKRYNPGDFIDLRDNPWKNENKMIGKEKSEGYMRRATEKEVAEATGNREPLSPWKDKEWLSSQFHDEHKPFKKIADENNTTSATIRYWFKKHGLRKTKR